MENLEKRINQALISILLPVKNGAKYISECIDSIFKQSEPNWELIIIDDHSTDVTVKIVNDYMSIDSRIKFESNKDSGVIQALERGLEKSRGNFITRIDHDDIMPETRLEIMKRTLLEEGNGTVVTGLVKYISDSEVSEGYQNYERWLNQINLDGKQWKNIYRECVIASPNWMIWKDDLMRVGGFSKLGYPEDYHLVFRWYQNGFIIKCLNDISLLWREHPERTSRNSENYSQEAFFRLKINQFLDYEDNGGDLVLWGSGVKGKLTAGLLQEREREFIWMDLIQKTRNQDEKLILPYSEIENLNKPQLLISVYPDEREKNTIEDYLGKLNLYEGENYWYL